MGNNHDYIALDWVRGEIKQTLAQARMALEAFVDSKNDTTQMTFCLNHIHQVYGTLQMVEFYGAALLAEEMEKLCQSILEDQISSVQEALEVLMESLLQLENYLEHIQTGRRDLPVILLPILNDLRALQGQPLLSDTSLFTPDLSSAELVPNPEHNLRMQDPQVVANLRKLRQMFQFSLAGIIRNQDLAENLGYLYKVLARLEKFCQGTPLGYLWKVGVGYLDSIQGQQEGLSSATKQLLRDLDHQIKMMIDESSTILSKPVPADLLKNLLYYVARTDVSTKRIDELKSIFNLDQALPSEQELDKERQRLQGPGQETMTSVVDALSDELNLIKDSLDLFVRGDHKDKHELTDLMPPMTQIANTMAILGLGVGRKVILDQIDKIKLVSDSDEPVSEQMLMDMAGALLYVEANLITLTDTNRTSFSEGAEDDEHQGGDFVVPAEHFESAHNAVIFESKNGLEQAKNGIVNFIASQWDHSEIEDVPDLLDSIRGGLQIIPLPQAAKLLEACGQYIRQVLLTEKSVPDWQQLDRLADAITSIEYYMERLSEGAQDNERILRVAEESVAKLGFPTSDISRDTDASEVSLHHVSSVASESPDAVSKESDDRLIDEEILAIFVEEADEVMECIANAMTQIRSNYDDQNALKELRRAFHTLKGSGRLVGANQIAELSWSVEHLLNKFLDTKQIPEPVTIDFLDKVVERLPQLKEDFSNQQASSDYQHLIAQAEAMSAQFSLSRHTETDEQNKVAPVVEVAEEERLDAEPVLPESQSGSVEEAQQEESGEEETEEDDLIDDEILEIFIEEAGEVLETINTYLPVFLDDYSNKEALTELRRAFHTLKGSGRMVGASAIGETAWAIESMLNRVIDGSILINQDIAELVQHTVKIIPELVENFELHTKPTADLALIERQAAALSNGEFVSSLSAIKASPDAETAEPVADQSSDSSVGIDSTLLEIFENEAMTHVETIEDFIRSISEDNTAPINDDISRALHTLKGSANTANIVPIAEIAVPVEKFIKEMRAHNLEVNYPVAQLLATAMDLTKEGVAQLSGDAQQKLTGTDDFLSSLVELQRTVMRDLPEDGALIEASSQDPQVVSIFLTEGLDILLDAESILDEWSDNPVSGATLGKLVGEVKTLHRGATVAGLDSIAELCECLEECYACIEIGKHQPSEVFLSDIKLGHDSLIDMMDQVAAGLSAASNNKLLAELRGHVVAQKKRDESESEVVESSLDDDGLNSSLDKLEKQLDGVLPSFSTSEELEANDAGEAHTETLPHHDSESDDLMDSDLAEIFLEEAREIIGSMLPALEHLKDKPDSPDTLAQLQRDLHTLKGGARMAGIDAVGDLSGALEKIFERLVDTREAPGALLLSLFDDAHQALGKMLEAIENGQTCQPCDDLIEKLNQAAAGDTLQPVPSSQQRDSEVDASLSADSQSSTTDENIDLDPELVEIFLEEAREIIDNSGELLHQWASDTGNLELVAELQRELHTLKGGARMAEVASIGDLSHELETLFELTAESRFEVSSDMVSLCLSCHDALAQMVDSVSEGRATVPATQLLEQIKRALKTGAFGSGEQSVAQVEKEIDSASVEGSNVTSDEYDGDLLSLFLEESKDILATASDCIDLWQEDQDGIDGVVELQREMHTLKGGARLADIDAVGDLADVVNRRLEQLIDGDIPDHKPLFVSVKKAYQEMTEMLESLIHGETITPLPDLIAEISVAGSVPDAIRADHDTADADSQSLLGPVDDVDAEVVEMFVEEAGELIEALEEQISTWSKNPASDEPNLEIQRILHTLKGGARLSNLGVLADESHDLETQLIEAMTQGVAFDGDLKQAVLAKQDTLLKLVDEIQKFSTGSEADQPAEEQKAEDVETTASAPTPTESDNQLVERKKDVAATSITSASPAPKKENRQPAKQKMAPQETIRVSAGLLEELVNLAGETSISRGRLEQQISDFGFTLEEMSATIDRLREQLRRMDMETEAQVLFSAEKEGLAGPDYSDFDPLEMDRYSSIQQLSRALTESTSDLSELRDTLSDRARDAETLLLQQSRINSELQEGLMKTRMIPFSFMVPRLRRIVRQIGGELGKQVDFDVLNAEGEMDRSVLERMVAPLEHMLRNALDHGIETAEQREKAGKPAAGTVTLSLSREGGDVVLKMKDDGAGIDEAQVLKKAIKQGLTPKDTELTPHEIQQFIMLPGFSTAEQITQISGRGVGMDVVASEIKQMGGSISIESVHGRGTEFIVRLPFTVSVNRALMVNTGEDFYAIPLNTIEGIVRVSSYELEEYYKPDAPLYEYAGQKYKLQYLGNLMHSIHQPKLQGQALPLPVILVRGTDQPMALQVDSLMGSREIVVKSLGLQFAGVHGVSGATILGDGSVVVILDLPALIRDESIGLLDAVDVDKAVVEDDQQAKVVMVIDDSVTVRKVTTRLLERNGMEVITAKDGVDAIALLQDHKPDVMLLDIEMPRMDGFEVATLVRHDERLKDIPIIMITSRTGQKHKERAFAIGVNEYLGKPFQEADLLENIKRVTD